MVFYWILVIAIAGALGDDSCPTAAELSPCTCDGEGLNCISAKTVGDLRKAFKSNFKYGGVRAVWIQGTPITNLPGDVFGNIKSQQFFVEVNGLTSVDLKAFNASREILTMLSLFGNKLKDLTYKDFSLYENLGTLNLGRNLIQTIPDEAFNLRRLHAIILQQNKITHIGKNAFANLPNLANLDMSNNPLATLGPNSFAFKSHNPGLKINLLGNQISQVNASAFDGANPEQVLLNFNKLTELKFYPFSSLIASIVQKGGILDVTANPFSCRGCEYNWLILNRYAIANTLRGFQCLDRRTLYDLTNANVGCPN